MSNITGNKTALENSVAEAQEKAEKSKMAAQTAEMEIDNEPGTAGSNEGEKQTGQNPVQKMPPGSFLNPSKKLAPAAFADSTESRPPFDENSTSEQSTKKRKTRQNSPSGREEKIDNLLSPLEYDVQSTIPPENLPTSVNAVYLSNLPPYDDYNATLEYFPGHFETLNKTAGLSSLLLNQDIIFPYDSDDDTAFFEARQLSDTENRQNVLSAIQTRARSSIESVKAMALEATARKDVIKKYLTTIKHVLHGKMDEQGELIIPAPVTMDCKGYLEATVRHLEKAKARLSTVAAVAFSQFFKRLYRDGRWSRERGYRQLVTKGPKTRPVYNSDPSRWHIASRDQMQRADKAQMIHEPLQDAPYYIQALAPHTGHLNWVALHNHNVHAAHLKKPKMTAKQAGAKSGANPQRLQLVFSGWDKEQFDESEVSTAINTLPWLNITDRIVFPKAEGRNIPRCIVTTEKPTPLIWAYIKKRTILVGHIIMSVRVTSNDTGVKTGVTVAIASLTSYARKTFKPSDIPYKMEEYIKKRFKIDVLMYPRPLIPRWLNAICSTGELEISFKNQNHLIRYKALANNAEDLVALPLLITSIPGQTSATIRRGTSKLELGGKQGEWKMDLIGVTLTTSPQMIMDFLDDERVVDIATCLPKLNSSGYSNNIRITFDVQSQRDRACELLAGRSIGNMNKGRPFIVSLVYNNVPKDMCLHCYHPDNEDKTLCHGHKAHKCPRREMVCSVCHGDDHVMRDCSYTEEIIRKKPRATHVPVQKTPRKPRHQQEGSHRARKGRTHTQDQKGKRARSDKATRSSNTKQMPRDDDEDGDDDDDDYGNDDDDDYGNDDDDDYDHNRTSTRRHSKTRKNIGAALESIAEDNAAEQGHYETKEEGTRDEEEWEMGSTVSARHRGRSQTLAVTAEDSDDST